MSGSIRSFPVGWVVRHWRGELSLGQAFWINLVAVRIGLIMMDDLFRPPTMSYVGDHLVLAIAYAAFATFVVFPWQIVGVLRASDRLTQEPGNSAIVMCAQIGVVIAGLAAVISPYAIFQPLMVERPTEPPYVTRERERASKYAITVDRSGHRLDIRGDFELGMTRALRRVLVDHPNVSVVVLDSEGGYVNQGRAVAKVILDHGFDTHVDGECSSSCTLAFAAGAMRTIGPDAKLGFHRYYYNYRTVHPSIDDDEEQHRDEIYLLGRGIKRDFLDRAVKTPPEDIWYPSHRELLDAGMIDAVMPLSPDL